MRPGLLLLVSVLAIASGCLTIETNALPCETDQDCVDATNTELDACGQEGFDVCCGAGAYKCKCSPELACLEDYVCFECGPDNVCGNDQGTICLDGFSGGLAGLTPTG